MFGYVVLKCYFVSSRLEMKLKVCFGFVFEWPPLVFFVNALSVLTLALRPNKNRRMCVHLFRDSLLFPFHIKLRLLLLHTHTLFSAIATSKMASLSFYFLFFDFFGSLFTL